MSAETTPGTTGRPAEVDHVIVVIPARDEASSIAACLRSVRRARRHLERERVTLGAAPVTVHVVVVADSCRDRTARVAERVLRRDDATVVEVAVGSVGPAREVGVAAGLHRLGSVGARLDRVWVASTDADTVVPADWLTTQLAVAAEGHIAVAGVVRLRPHTVDDQRVARLFGERYALDDRPLVDDDEHPHVHGANLGLRADALAAAGGWPPLSTGEDVELWRRLRRIGPTRATARSVVATSARRVGRAPRGVAADIDALAHEVGRGVFALDGEGAA